MKIHHFLFVALVILSSCKGYETSPITIIPEKKSHYKELGYGVYTYVPPRGFNKARRYKGFQGPSYSSISVETTSNSISEVKKSFDLKLLDHRKTDLLAMQPVNYGQHEDAFYSLVHDNRKKTFRFLLAVNDGSKTYLIKAFCTENRFDSLGEQLEKAVKSAFIGTFKEAVTEYKLAGIEDSQTIYTKDGKHPTQDPSGSKLRLQILDEPREFFTDFKIKQILWEANEKTTGKKAKVSYSMEFLGNGKIYSSRRTGEVYSSYAAIYVLDNEDSFFVEGVVKKDFNINDIVDYIKTEFTEMKIM